MSAKYFYGNEFADACVANTPGRTFTPQSTPFMEAVHRKTGFLRHLAAVVGPEGYATHTYPTVDDATDAAEDFALLNPGVPFVVMAVVCEVSASTPEPEVTLNYL